jgi:ATP-binding cassette, subfamily F, member 3
MMRLEDITVAVGGYALIEGASLHIRPGDRIGVVGPNGSGKTTLLRVLIGETDPEAGKIHRRKGLQVGYLAQKGIAGGPGTVWEEAAAGMTRLHKFARRLEAAAAAVEGGEPGAEERLGECEESFRLAGGYSMDERVGEVLSGLGFLKDDWGRPARELSGGWQMRVALARLLLSDADLLILDEPTNHLDMKARAWLGSYLSGHDGALVIVSHDRLVLDAVSTRIVEIFGAKLWGAPGNLSQWLKEREQRLAQHRQAYRMQQAEIARLERFVERFKAKATKAAQARSRQKVLDKMDRIDAPDVTKLPRFKLPEAPDSVYDLIKTRDLVAGWPGAEPMVQGVGFELHRGMRLALVGPNGCGKSTLLKTLSGQLALRGGERILGKGAAMGVYDQDVASALPVDQTPLELLMAVALDITLTDAWSALGALGLGGEAAQRSIGVLSGGERSRVALALLSLVPHNLLLLDEPTNHLDAVTIDALIEPLVTFEGAMVIVSHDRYLLNRVATHIGRVIDGTLHIQEGTAALDLLDAIEGQKPEDASAGGVAYKEAKKRARQVERTRKRVTQIEAEVEALEAEVAGVDERLFEEAGDFQRARELNAQRETLTKRVEALYSEWEVLEEALSHEES